MRRPPAVQALKWDVEAGRASINDLHRVMGPLVRDLSGSAAGPADFLEFVQRSYNERFGRASTRAKGAS